MVKVLRLLIDRTEGSFRGGCVECKALSEYNPQAAEDVLGSCKALRSLCAERRKKIGKGSNDRRNEVVKFH